MVKKIFWALVLLGVYLGLMLTGNDQFISLGFEKIKSYITLFLEDLEVLH